MYTRFYILIVLYTIKFGKVQYSMHKELIGIILYEKKSNAYKLQSCTYPQSPVVS